MPTRVVLVVGSQKHGKLRPLGPSSRLFVDTTLHSLVMRRKIYKALFTHSLPARARPCFCIDTGTLLGRNQTIPSFRFSAGILPQFINFNGICADPILPVVSEHKALLNFLNMKSRHCRYYMMGWMVHRKRKESKQQPNMLPGSAVPGCCLISFHFLWAIHPIRPVQGWAKARQKSGP